MLKGVSMKELAIYHPTYQLDNEHFIQHFEKQDKDIVGLLEKIGSKVRYQIKGTEENSLTMAIEAASAVLTKAQVAIEDIDMIVFISMTPERLSPTNALMIHEALAGKEETLCYDLNANCIGMFIGVEQITRTLVTSNNKRALVIGSDFYSLIMHPENPVTYPTFGEAAVALILEKDHSDSELIDVVYQSNTNFTEEIVYPPKGLAKTIREKEDARYMYWGNFDGIDSVKFAIDSIPKMLEKHQLTTNDIGAYCFSQLSKKNINLIKEALDLPADKVSYVGDRYGYTGNNSPFLALYEDIQAGKIKRGDYIMFWTLGSGYQAGTMLWRY